jgi:hypothetical protein
MIHGENCDCLFNYWIDSDTGESFSSIYVRGMKCKIEKILPQLDSPLMDDRDADGVPY